MKHYLSFIFAVVLVIGLFFACAKKERKSDKEWYEEDKKEFMRDCTGRKDIRLTSEKRKAYCECMMNKIMNKYPNYAEANKNADEITKLFYDECMKEAGYNNE